MKLKKTDYVVICILIVVAIAGIVGVVLAINLMGENDQKAREERNRTMSNLNTIENSANENQMLNGVDANTTPNEQMQQLVNSIPGVINGSNDTTSIKSIKIRYAYGYDVTLADQLKFLDVLEYDCKDEELTALGKLIENNKIDENAKDEPTSNTASYCNTQFVVDGEKTIAFSDKNALYHYNGKTKYVIINDDVLKKVAEIVNREAEKKVTKIDGNSVKSLVITNDNNVSVTTADASDIQTICECASYVNLNGSVVDLSQQQVIYTVELSNGTKFKVTTDGVTGYVSTKNGEQQVKFMFNLGSGLESIFKKYSD